MKTFYIEKLDKHRFILHKTKIENDNFKIYADLERTNNIKKVIKKLIKCGATNVVLSKELFENQNLINALNSSNIKIFDGRWLEKYLSFEILDYAIRQNNLKKEEIEIAITTNEITDISIEIIKELAKQYKRITVVTNHIEKLKKIEEEIYEKSGILIVVSNNQKKSLLRSKIILNIDFNKEVFNRYKINENAIIINLEGNMKIYSKRFNGININDYDIEVGREDTIWRENMQNFKAKDLLEANLYGKDTFKHIRSKIEKNKVSIKEIFGINGKIFIG
mgnify:CR=1 FL=1